MSLTTHLGFGQFQLADFLPGELFARFDGTLAKLADPQPPGRPDHILIWNNHTTSNAERLWLHKTALAYDVTPAPLHNARKERRTMNDAYSYVSAELASQVPPLYATEDNSDPTVWIKLFTPDSNWTWYLTEFDPSEKLAFGLVVGPATELGYFSLAELEQSRGPLGSRVERDLHFRPQPLSQVQALHP